MHISTLIFVLITGTIVSASPLNFVAPSVTLSKRVWSSTNEVDLRFLKEASQEESRTPYAPSYSGMMIEYQLMTTIDLWFYAVQAEELQPRDADIQENQAFWIEALYKVSRMSKQEQARIQALRGGVLHPTFLHGKLGILETEIARHTLWYEAMKTHRISHPQGNLRLTQLLENALNEWYTQVQNGKIIPSASRKADFDRLRDEIQT